MSTNIPISHAPTFGAGSVQQHTPPAMSLFKIEAELLQLMQLREETAADADMTPAEIAESMKAIDQAIEEYVKREVQKADGIAAYLRECEARAETLAKEAKRLMATAAAWDKRRELVENVTRAAMQSMGKKLIEGGNSTLKLAKNPASVEVVQPDLVPDDYMRIKVTMTRALRGRILARLFGDKASVSLFQELMECSASDPEPMKTLIKEELKQPCPNCKGQWDQMKGQSTASVCGVCGGSGILGVPGCRLVNDRMRLEIK